VLGGQYLTLYGYDTSYAFGHLGLSNLVTWADPQRHLSAAVLTSGKPVLYPELYRAFALNYAIAAACPKDDSVPPTPPVELRPRKAGKAAAGHGADKTDKKKRRKKDGKMDGKKDGKKIR